jgi:hypothetical protein
MRLPARWFIVLAAVVTIVLALSANAIADQLESPAAGLSATNGPSLAAPTPDETLGAEHTRAFDVVTRVARSGQVRVTETIVQDFGVVARHGIERVIPLRDDRGEHKLSHLVVSTSSGTPAHVAIDTQTDTVTIRIGDADTTITGAHTYRVAYDLGGMITGTGRHQSKLAIDAISAWQQQIDSLQYRIESPGQPTSIGCTQGDVGSKHPCAAVGHQGSDAVFAGRDLAPDEAFTMRLTWPSTVVAVNATDTTIGIADVGYALLLGLAIAFVGWRYRRRWHQLLTAAQTQLWSTFGPDVAGAQPEAYDLTRDPAIEFVPPMGLRPGEIGTLVEADSTHLLTATVVDLAARGALKITETGGSWQIERRNRDVVLTDDEQTVMHGLFAADGDVDDTTETDSTSLEGRGTEMGALAAVLAEQLTNDLEARGLATPGTHAGGVHSTMRQWPLLALGAGAVLLGLAAHVIVVTATGNRGFGLAVEAVVALVTILAVGAFFVRRAAKGLTPTGLAASWRVRGFDHFFTASEAVHDRAAADKGLFRQYMGYAIVYGHVSQWVAAFESPDTSDWFATTTPLSYAFIGFTAASVWSPPASTSTSGFGGGGFGAGGGSGGGGGGSW